MTLSPLAVNVALTRCVFPFVQELEYDIVLLRDKEFVSPDGAVRFMTCDHVPLLFCISNFTELTLMSYLARVEHVNVADMDVVSIMEALEMFLFARAPTTTGIETKIKASIRSITLIQLSSTGVQLSFLSVIPLAL